MKRNSIAGKVGLTLAIALVLTVATYGHASVKGNAAAIRMSAARTALSSIASFACTTHCAYNLCVGTQHDNWTTGSNPDDGGEEHTCATSSNGCGDHTCNQTEEALTLAAIIPNLQVDEIRLLAEENERFLLNSARGAIQILGCNQKVVVSAPLTEAQQAGLGSSDSPQMTR